MIFKTKNSNICNNIDTIKIKTGIILTDKNDNAINIETLPPKYKSEIFSPYHKHESPILTEKYKKMYDVIFKTFNRDLI